MAFNTRSQFISAQSSEKLILAHIDGRARLYEWTLVGSGVWSKVVPYFVSTLKQNDNYMVDHGQLSGLNEGMFYYDPLTSTLYAHFDGSADPATIEAIVTYRFFYASGPVTASYDLTDSGTHVNYEGRIQSSPGYDHKIGVDQSLVSVVGSGTLKLENGDGGLDDKFDSIYYENRQVTIYSWNRDLPFSEAKVIYRGRVTNKTYSSDSVSFKIKDTIFDLEQVVPLVSYNDNDNVNENIKGNYKRWLYGRVDGLQLQSIDQIGSGYSIAGTVSANAASATLTGVGTSFLSDTSPGDEITVGTQTFGISSVNSDTDITLDDEVDFAFTGQTAVLNPQIPTTNKNRQFFVTGHACSELNYTILQFIQLNRVKLSSTIGLRAGDLIEFTTGERKEIKNVAPGNIVVLQSNLIVTPSLPSSVKRQPVQKLYKGSSAINADNFTISNLGAPSNQCTITLEPTVEFDLARAKNYPYTLVFTNGSRTLTTSDNVDLREIFSSRDWIRPANLSYTTYYEILSVDSQQIELRVVFNEPSITDTITAKLPDYIGDNTVISSEVIGKTVSGEPDGVWIRTGSQAIRDILREINVSDDLVNESSFTQAETDGPAIISMSIPSSPSGRSVTAKSVVDLINESIFGSLTLDNDLKLFYKILQLDTPDAPTQIYDEDIIKWSISTTNGKNFRDSLVRYQHKDIDRFSLSSGSSVKTFSSQFVDRYIETSKQKEFDAYIFNPEEAAIYAERQVYYNRLSQSKISIETDLRLENIQIGDVVQLEMQRLYKRLGDNNSSKKLAIVTGKTVTGTSIKFEMTDLGNLFNTSAVIAPNTTNEYGSATEDEKLKYGFITDGQGVVDNDEQTANVNLIS